MEIPETKSTKPKPWHPEWWIAGFGSAQRSDCIKRIETGATPDASYYVLIVLSTLIASYGLLSNSTATVIGAMIVAPLMGPILGLAMGTVLGDTKMFRRSLMAEITGVVLVIATGFFVAQVVGISQIDFAASEIANRTRPTLFDLAIGFAAGLAGAFCLVHPGLQAGIAGVAIAVALVPPLSVTGLTTAGWMAGELPWRPAFGSFMLFLANFLTIELASGLFFSVMGFRVRREEHERGAFRRAIAIQLLLLIATGVFLSGQLATLVRERVGLSVSRQAVRTALLNIPGADLDDLRVELQGSKLNVKAVVGSRTELTPAQVADMEAQVQEALQTRLETVKVRLIVRTVSSTYASASSFLYEPQDAPPSSEQLRSQQLETALRNLLTHYPGIELGGFKHVAANRPAEPQDKTERAKLDGLLEVTLSSPYPFSPNLVAEFEDRLNLALQGVEGFEVPLRLLVRTTTVSTATASGAVTISAPKSFEDEESGNLDKLTFEAANSLLPQKLLQVSTRRISSADDKVQYSAMLEFEGEALVSQAQAQRLRAEVESLFQERWGRVLSLNLDINSRLARNLEVHDDSPTSLSEQPLAEELVALAKAERVLIDTSSISISGPPTKEIRVHAVAYSERLLPNSTVLLWQKQLKKKHPEIVSLELTLENRLGKTIRLTPSR